MLPVRRKRREGKTLGALVVELLASALHGAGEPARPFQGHTQSMRALVDLEERT